MLSGEYEQGTQFAHFCLCPNLWALEDTVITSRRTHPWRRNVRSCISHASTRFR
jgi:hypothetical protein